MKHQHMIIINNDRSSDDPSRQTLFPVSTLAINLVRQVRRQSRILTNNRGCICSVRLSPCRTRADLQRAAILFIDLSAPPELKRSWPEAEILPDETKIRLEKNNTSQKKLL